MKTFTLSGCKLSSPVVAAAGFQNGLDSAVITQKFQELIRTDIGAVTLGSFTVPLNEGNEIKFGPPVYYYDDKAGKTYNSMGLSNIGLEQGAELVNKLAPKAHKAGKILIASGSPLGSDAFGSSVDQALRLAKELQATKADLIEVNLSCPNVVTEEGGRKPIMGYDLKSIEELLSGLKRAMPDRTKIGLKMPPFLSREEKSLVPKIADLLAQKPIGFIVVCNTVPNQIPTDKTGRPILSVPGGAGGLSGPALKQEGRRQLKLWKKYLHQSMDVISLLGVDSIEEVSERLKLGAAAAGGVSFFREKLSLLAYLKANQ